MLANHPYFKYKLFIIDFALVIGWIFGSGVLITQNDIWLNVAGWISVGLLTVTVRKAIIMYNDLKTFESLMMKLKEEQDSETED